VRDCTYANSRRVYIGPDLLKYYPVSQVPILPLVARSWSDILQKSYNFGLLMDIREAQKDLSSSIFHRDWETYYP
jgi:hypothetical protein